MQPPIADPHVTSENRFGGDDVRLFRTKFWPYYLTTLTLEFVLVGPFLAFTIYPVFARHPKRFALAMAVAAATIAALMLFFCTLSYWFTPVKTSAWGMRAFSFWSVPREVAWPEITSVQFLWRGYSYMVVHASNGEKLWIFLPIRDERGFAQSVVTHTASDHPLHEFLRQRGLLN